MCDDLMKAGIAIEEVEIYSTSVLIECMENDRLVIIPDCWSSIHPHSKTVSFIREYKCPYGFFLSKTASNAAKMFIRYKDVYPIYRTIAFTRLPAAVDGSVGALMCFNPN